MINTWFLVDHLVTIVHIEGNDFREKIFGEFVITLFLRKFNVFSCENHCRFVSNFMVYFVTLCCRSVIIFSTYYGIWTDFSDSEYTFVLRSLVIGWWKLDGDVLYRFCGSLMLLFPAFLLWFVITNLYWCFVKKMVRVFGSVFFLEMLGERVFSTFFCFVEIDIIYCD